MNNILTLIQAAKNAARHFSQRYMKEGYKPAGFYVYRDTVGQPSYYRFRLDHPDGRKIIRPMFQNTTGKFEMTEPALPQGSLKPLYDLYLISLYPEATIYIVEGEKVVDALNCFFKAQGVNEQYLAITSGGATSANIADWQPLAGRKIIGWPDHDEPGQQYLIDACGALNQLGCSVQIVDVEKLALPAKGDAFDWLTFNNNATIDVLLNLPIVKGQEIVPSDEPTHQIDEGEKRQNQASILVAFVLDQVELFHDKNMDVYARYKSTQETHRLESRRFKDWIVSSFFSETKKSAHDQSVREAINTLSGLARSKGECHEVNIRVASHDGSYYIDLAQPGSSHAIELKPGGWSIIDQPPVYFLRPDTMRPLPIPISGGDITSLWGIINVPENCRCLVLAWLIECFRPDTPFPVLEFFGEQGSAKSTTQTILRRLIDPNASDLRAAPKTPEDIFVCAGVNWLASYENISHLSPAMQDAFCVLSTGAGYAKRKLYSDADESVIQVKRPIVLNGISIAVTSQDLVDRTISIETPVIENRLEGRELLKVFETIQGELLGALLDIAAKALSIVHTIELPPAERPRLLEFAHLGMAIAQVMEGTPEPFLRQFNAARQESIARTIDASPVALAFLDWIETQPSPIEITVKDLFHAVEMYKPINTESWPRSPKGFADTLRRLAPALRQMGIQCRSIGKRGSHVYWEIKPPAR